jgi:hypothetical protein
MFNYESAEFIAFMRLNFNSHTSLAALSSAEIGARSKHS